MSAVLAPACSNNDAPALTPLDPGTTTPDSAAPPEDDAHVSDDAMATGDDASDAPMCSMTFESLLQSAGRFTQSCIECYERSCAVVIQQCDQNCACPNALSQAFQCVEIGGSEQACLGVILPILGANTVLQIGECSALCTTTCKSSKDGGTDLDGASGTDAATDASSSDGAADASDASADAGRDAALDAASDASDSGSSGGSH